MSSNAESLLKVVAEGGMVAGRPSEPSDLKLQQMLLGVIRGAMVYANSELDGDESERLAEQYLRALAEGAFLPKEAA